MSDPTIILMAAGKGTRLTPYSKQIPKVLMKVGDQTLLERNLAIVRNRFKRKDVHLVLGRQSGEIKRYLSEKNNFGMDVALTVIEDEDILKGLTFTLLKLRPLIRSHFLFILGDEIYFSPDHDKMLEAMRKNSDYDIYCMIKDSVSPSQILRNYAVHADGDVIASVAEKPAAITTRYAGLGTIACSLKVFPLLEREMTRRKPRHFIDVLNQGIRDGLKAYSFETSSDYFNINDKDDLFQALRYERSRRISDAVISVVMPAYNEAGTVGYVVRDLKPYADEIIVMDNESPDGTARVAEAAGARVISRPLKGYGDAIQQGLREARGDILVVTESDFTFRAADISKFLEFLKDADAVLGTRTNRSFIFEQANMGFLLRCGNILFGKILSLLWWNRKCRLTDVGCTYRALWRSSYEEIKDNLTSRGPEYAPEMVVEMLNSFLRLVEIPVSYSERVTGESKISISTWHSAKVALRMLNCILSKRIKGWWANLRSVLSRGSAS